MSRLLTSLRYRFFLALGVVLLLALVAMGTIAQQLVIPALLAKEEEYAALELERIRRAIDNELAHLNLTNRDWAVWDDSYDFIQGRGGDYQASNLAEGLVFEEANLRMMIFLSADRQSYLIAGIDPDSGDYTSCPAPTGSCAWAAPFVESLQVRIEANSSSDQTWLQAFPERAMVSASPIVKSDGSGPLAGWLSMVRVMNDEWLARLEESTGIDLSVSTVATTLEAGLTPISIRRLDSQTMLTTQALDAAPNGYHIDVQAILMRQSFKANIETFRFALYWTVGLLIIVIVVVLALLERMVLSPLRQFAAFTQQVQRESDINASPSLLKRRDEIGTLAREFQQLLEYQRRQTSSLVELSQRDPLTGLANRRLFDESLENALDQQHDVALLMVDIDGFKSYNDHYGHPAGDVCLKTIAEAMRQHFQHTQQLVARIGGEEFAILLSPTSAEHATQQAESLRVAIQALALPHASAPTSAAVVTVSIGVALFNPQSPISTSALIDAADSALYRAKQAGRNRVGQDALNALPE